MRLCGRRFALLAKCAPWPTACESYSNCASVALWSIVPLTLQPVDHVCVFRNVPLQSGENQLVAIADGARDEMTLFGVNATLRGIRFARGQLSWLGTGSMQNRANRSFCTSPAGRFSIRDTLGALMDAPSGGEAMLEEILRLDRAARQRAKAARLFGKRFVENGARHEHFGSYPHDPRERSRPPNSWPSSRRLGNALEKTAADAE